LGRISRINPKLPVYKICSSPQDCGISRMHVHVIAREELRISFTPAADLSFSFSDSPVSVSADAVIDLHFSNSSDRIAALRSMAPLVIIGSVLHTLSETDLSFVRVNHWPPLFSGTVVEAAADASKRKDAEEIFRALGKTITWLPDNPGFITARVLACIINEAFLSLEEGVSTKEEIDAAMKLGTNYPFGPFEWAERIGTGEVNALLQKLSFSNPRYSPSPAL